MSDMQAVKVTLQRMAPIYESIHLAAIEKFDKYSDELYDYLQRNDIKYLNGVVYKGYIEDLDPYGFTTCTENENGSTEIVALWYNGGASLDEVLEIVLK